MQEQKEMQSTYTLGMVRKIIRKELKELGAVDISDKLIDKFTNEAIEEIYLIITESKDVTKNN